MTQAFVAFAMPDLILSAMNFVLYMDSLVDGNPLGSPTGGAGGRSDATCLIASILMYTIVTCTYFAPVTVAFFTFVKFNAIARGRTAAWSRSSVLCVSLALPAAIGLVLASAALSTRVESQSVLGQYRGLYCYIRKWESFVTGGVLTMLFVLTVAATIVWYALAALSVAKVTRRSAAHSKAPLVVMRRGLLLTVTYVATWVWFSTTSFLAFLTRPASLTVELVGAVIINAQPIIDAAILLSLPNIRMDYHTRQLKWLGVSSMTSGATSASSSSSTTSSSDFFGSQTNSTVAV